MDYLDRERDYNKRVAKNVASLLASSRGDVKTVHDLRRDVKKLEALTRTLRVLYRKPAGRLLPKLHGIAVKLGTHRDRDVVIDYLRRKRIMIPELKGRSTSRARVPALVRNASQAILETEIDLTDFLWQVRPSSGDIVWALRKRWSQARNSFRKIERFAREQDLHRLRRQVKDLQFQFEALGLGKKESGKKIMQQLKSLGSRLGDVHDRFMIAAWLRNLLAAKDRDKIRELLEREKNLALKSALQIGRKTFRGRRPGI